MFSESYFTFSIYSIYIFLNKNIYFFKYIRKVWGGKDNVTNAVSVFQFQVGKAALWAAEQMFRSTNYLICGFLSAVLNF